MSLKEIMALPSNDRLSYSLKVYAAAHFIGMQEYTGEPDGLEARGLLSICEEEIARGHEIELR